MGLLMPLGIKVGFCQYLLESLWPNIPLTVDMGLLIPSSIHVSLYQYPLEGIWLNIL